jgi:hypothetical protein
VAKSSSREPAHLPYQPFERVWLLQEDRAWSEVVRSRAALSRSDDDANSVMVVLDVARELEPV